MLNKLITDLKVNWEEIEKIPEFQRLSEGGYHSEWHQEGSTMVHTKMVVKACRDHLDEDSYNFSTNEKFIMVAASLFHDIGKGKVARLKEDGNWSAPYHALEGERLTRFMLWDEDFVTREKICSLVKHHMKPKYLRFKIDDIEKNVIQFAHNTDCRLLYYLNLFDIKGTVRDNIEEDIQHSELLKQTAKKLGVWKTKPLRYPKKETDFNIIILCGVAGAGKTTAYKTYYEPLGYELISRDIIREELGMVSKDGKLKGTKEQEDRITHIEHKRIKELCEQKKSFVSDNLFIRKKYRDGFIQMVSPYNPHITIEYHETSKQNHIDRRKGQVEPNAILKMMREMDFPYPTEADVVVYMFNGAYKHPHL
jgi:predicted kinase